MRRLFQRLVLNRILKYKLVPSCVIVLQLNPALPPLRIPQLIPKLQEVLMLESGYNLYTARSISGCIRGYSHTP